MPGQKPARLPVLAKGDVVVAFGDSITFGTGAEMRESYPVVLEQMIGRKVVNAVAFSDLFKMIKAQRPG